MNNWNEKIEKTIYTLGAKCGAYRILHDESSSYYQKLDKILSIISISLSTVAGTTIFSFDTKDLRVVEGIIVYLTGVLTSIKQFLNYIKLSEKHRTYSIRFSGLYRDIHTQLCLEKKDRIDGIEYLHFVNTEIDNLLFTNPPIPSRIKKKRIDENSAQETSMSKDIYDIILKIDSSPTANTKFEEKQDQGIEESSESSIENTVNKYRSYVIDKFMMAN